MSEKKRKDKWIEQTFDGRQKHGGSSHKSRKTLPWELRTGPTRPEWADKGGA